jgi:hypothetical protein
MDALQLLVRGRSGRDDLTAAFPPPIRNYVHDLSPFGTLGMAGRGFVFSEVVGGNQDQRHGRTTLVATPNQLKCPALESPQPLLDLQPR